MGRLVVTEYKSILQQIEAVDPVAYGKSRNYTDGAVTRLSAYISRGVISTRQVLRAMLDKGYQLHEIESFVQELCWRDYFQRVGQHKDLNSEIKQPQQPVAHHGIPAAVLLASTGIDGIDAAIHELYRTGYMHNHCRMYVAALVCNVARAHWLHPAQWMYYHLLDGDWASNVCSWQWVAGANSNKKYYANQENINKYTHTRQQHTFLDTSYEALQQMEIPAVLTDTQKFVPEVFLPPVSSVVIDPLLPTFIYNYYNIDPLWHQHEPGNRVLLMDPDFFAIYPVSQNCIDFVLALAENIPGIQVYTGSFAAFKKECGVENIYYKEHPLNTGYTGKEEPRDWITDGVTGYHPSFFSYWKKVEKQLYQ